MICSHCNMEVPDNLDHCPYCGEKLEAPVSENSNTKQVSNKTDSSDKENSDKDAKGKTVTPGNSEGTEGQHRKKSLMAGITAIILVAAAAAAVFAALQRPPKPNNEEQSKTPSTIEMAQGTEQHPSEEPVVEEEPVPAEKEEPAKEEAAAETSITGTYMGQLDYTEQASKEFSESLGFEVEGPLYMDVYLDLNEDNTFHLYVDAEKYKADVIAILTSHIDDIIAKSLEQNGMTMDQLGEVAESQGYGSEEEFKEAMVEMLEAELEESIDLAEYEDDLNISGTYAVSGKTILLANEDGTDVITINDDGTLTMIVPLDGERVEVIMTKQE